MAAERTSTGFGGTLREARERRGIALRQIAHTTKISVAALEALERNDISRLPGGIFSRAFVRSYAAEIGLDPETAVQEFIAQFPNESITAGHPASKRTEDVEPLVSDRRIAYAVVKLLAVGVPVAALALYLVLAARRPKAHDASAAPPAVAGEVSGAHGTSAATPTDSPFVIGLFASGKSSVSATVDGRQALAREMQAGDHEELTVRREIVLTAGDAGALLLTLDGADARPLGKPGESATVRLDASNLKDYLAPR